MKIDNQQRNNNLIYKGKIKKELHLQIIKEYIKGDSLVILGNKYGYNISTIRYFLIKNKIEIRSVKESVKKFHKKKRIIIDSFLHENLIGWILGDGGMRMSKTSLNPYFNYTDKKYGHIQYVSKILDNYKITYNITHSKISQCYQLQSESLIDFHYYYNLFYGYIGLNENNQKRKILPNIILTPTILLNWYIGDGSSSKQNKSFNNRGSISCKYKNEFILKQFNELFDVVKCYKNGECHTYHFSNKALKKLLEFIGECPVNDYKYKWIIRRSTTIIEPSK